MAENKWLAEATTLFMASRGPPCSSPRIEHHSCGNLESTQSFIKNQGRSFSGQDCYSSVVQNTVTTSIAQAMALIASNQAIRDFSTPIKTLKVQTAELPCLGHESPITGHGSPRNGHERQWLNMCTEVLFRPLDLRIVSQPVRITHLF